MKAITVKAFGDTSRLVLDEVAAPMAGPGELTIKVAFAGVGFVDTLIRSGQIPFPLPLVPGIEVSGHVHALGDGVSGLSLGQPVAALLTDFTSGGMGGYAQIARAKAALTVPLASDDDLAQAAAVIVNGATAQLALAGVGPGARIAVSGASGGLGRELIVAAHDKGFEIVAISGRRDRHEALRAIGATETVTPDAFDALDRDYDAAFDAVGGPLRLSLLRRLRPGGRLAILGNASGDNLPISGDDIWLRHLTVEGISTGGLSHLDPRRIAEGARAAIGLGRATPPEMEIISLDQAAEAHRRLEANMGSGKFLLKIGQD